MRLRLHSLQGRLLLLILLALIPALAVGAHHLWQLQRQERAAIEAGALAAVDTMAAQLEQVLAEGRQMLILLAAQPEVHRGDRTRCDALMAELLRGRPRYLNFGVIAPDGRLWCSGLPHSGELDLADRAYFQRAVAGRDFAVGEFQVGRTTGSASLNFGYPVQDSAGQLQGVVYAAVDLAWLAGVPSLDLLPPGSTLTVTDHRGTVLVHRPAAERALGGSLGDEPLARQLLTRDRGVFAAPDPDGIARIYAFTTLRHDLAGSFAHVTVGIPASAAITGVLQATRSLFGLLLIGLLTGAAAWWGGRRYIIAPVHTLLQATRRLSAGDLSARSRLGAAAALGELGELARAFDDMAASLQRRYNQAQSLARAADALNRTLDLDEVYTASCRQARTIFAAGAAAILAPDPQGETWRIIANDGLWPAATAKTFLTDSLLTKYLDRPDPVLVFSDSPADPPEPGSPDTTAAAGTVTAAVLRRDGRGVGALLLHHHHDRPLPAQDHPTLATFTKLSATAVANAGSHAAAVRRLEHLKALRQIDLSITAAPDLQHSLRVVLEQVRAQLRVDAAGVLLCDDATAVLQPVAQQGFTGTDYNRHSVKLGEGAAGEAALQRRLVLLADIAAAPACTRRDLAAAEGFVSFLCLPLVADNRLLGVLDIFHRSPLRAHPEWLELAETLAGQTAISVQTARLFAQLQEANSRLTAAYDTTLAGWSQALDLRDRETEGHSQRVTEGAVALARALGLSEEEITHVRRGALLHDVGKLGIPDRVLLKPGALDAAEWALMQQHPTLAYQWLSPIEFLAPALEIPYCHHEKWDGSGYPRGLAGTQIPLAARIFAVVDVFDALSSDRPYRPAWPREKVLAHIAAEAGRHFDPAVVRAFLELQSG